MSPTVKKMPLIGLIISMIVLLEGVIIWVLYGEGNIDILIRSMSISFLICVLALLLSCGIIYLINKSAERD